MPSEHIIINAEIVVNRFPEIPVEKAQEEREKWAMKKAYAKRRAAKMKEAGFYARAHRMNECAEVIGGKICTSCGHFHLTTASLCRDRLCPLCEWRLSMKRFAKMMALVNCIRAESDETWAAYTLTGKNCRGDELEFMLCEMSRAWNCIASAKKFKQHYSGWAKSLEITYNHDTHTFHPHFHILTVGDGCDSTYILQRWQKATTFATSWMAQETHRITSKWVDEPTSDDIVAAVLEAYKYAIKEQPDKKGRIIDDMPIGDFRILAESIGGKRLISFGGIIKEWAKELELEVEKDDDGETDADKARKECSKCGSKNLIEAVAVWCNDGYKWREIV